MSSDEPPDPTPEPSRSRLPLLMIGGVVILVLAFIGGRLIAPLVRDRPASAPTRGEDGASARGRNAGSRTASTCRSAARGEASPAQEGRGACPGATCGAGGADDG